MKISCILFTSCFQAQASLIAFFEFDSPTNFIADSSSNAIIATNAGASFDAAGFSGGAASFDGSSFIQVPIDIQISTLPNLTWGAWIKPTTTNAIQTVISHDNGSFDRGITIDSRGTPETGLAAFEGRSLVNSGIAPSITDWTFVAVSYENNASQLNFYAGSNSPITAATNFGDSGNDFFQIGRNPDFGENFTGLIDNVFVFDEALNEAQIEQIRLQGPANIPEPSGSLLSGISGLILLFRRLL